MEVEGYDTAQKLLCRLVPIPWSREKEEVIVLLLLVCLGREGVPKQSSLPHLAQLVDNKLGAIWCFTTQISVAAVGARVALLAMGWPCSWSWGKQTLLRADEAVKVRGRSVSIFLSTLLCAAWLLPLPSVPP